MKKQTNDNPLRMKPRWRFDSGGLSAFPGRWIRRQRPFPAAGAHLDNVLVNKSVPGSIRASRVLTGALAGQFSFYALWPRLLNMEMWSAMAPATAREGACASPKARTVLQDCHAVMPRESGPFFFIRLRFWSVAF